MITKKLAAERVAMENQIRELQLENTQMAQTIEHMQRGMEERSGDLANSEVLKRELEMQKELN